MSVSNDDSRVIQEGDYVILKNEKSTFSIRVSKSGNACLWKQKIKLSPIIGHRFGYKYEVKKGSVLRVEHNTNNPSQPEDKTEDISAKDNRHILDDGKSQKLSRTDIETLKADGLTGKEIVSSIVENSSTFQEKTEFSQAKYLNKKRRKYENVFTILQPTIRLLTDMYYSSNPIKIQNLRIDTLSQMLVAGNILCGGKYLTFDSCFGLLTAAVMQRLGRRGNVVQIHTGDLPPRNAIEMMNFNEEEKNVLSGLPISKIYDEEDEPQEPAAKRAKLERIDDNDQEKARQERRLKRQAEWKTAKQLLQEKNFDGLFIASKYDPNDCLMQLSDLVGISRPVVVFCMYKEPLLECYKSLRKTGNYINLKLTDTWLRHYQVLPERSHPEINMSGSGGFILSGTKVESSN